MTKLKIVVEYLVNLCYYLDNRERNGGTVMLDAIRGMYDGMIDENCSKREKTNFWSNLLYMFKLKRYAKKIDWSLIIEKNADICGGSAVIKGTRIRPEVIMERFKVICNSTEDMDSNRLLKKINQDYPTLSIDDILMAILYVIHKKGLRSCWTYK